MVFHGGHPPELTGAPFCYLPRTGGGGVAVGFILAILFKLLLTHDPGYGGPGSRQEFEDRYIGERHAGVDYPGVIIGGRLVAIVGEEYLPGVGSPGVFLTVPYLFEREDYVCNGHLAEALVKLDPLADVIGPRGAVSGDVPTFSQHRDDFVAVEVVHAERLGDGRRVVQEYLGVTR